MIIYYTVFDFKFTSLLVIGYDKYLAKKTERKITWDNTLGFVAFEPSGWNIHVVFLNMTNFKENLYGVFLALCCYRCVYILLFIIRGTNPFLIFILQKYSLDQININSVSRNKTRLDLKPNSLLIETFWFFFIKLLIDQNNYSLYFDVLPPSGFSV
jgi:hypothetical protein